MAANASSAASSGRSAPGASLSFFQHQKQRWQALEEREKMLITAAVCIVATALVWWIAIAPALGIVKSAPAQRVSIDAQLQKMQSLQAEAKVLQAQPKLSLNDASRSLEASVKQRLGTAAQLSLQGNQASLSLRNVPADALAQWLNQARVSARAIPIEARLRQSSTDPNAWDGTLVLALPAQ